MHRKLLIFALFLIFQHSFGQTFSSQDPSYVTNVQAGEMALKSEKYDSCLIYYEQAFEIKQTSFLSTLRAAACAFKANNKMVLDSYMDKAFKLNWDETRNIFYNYPEFEFLIGSEFEQDLNDRWEQAATDSGLDVELIKEFAEIRRTDQLYRQEMRGVSDKYGWQSPQMDSLWSLQLPVDSANTARISEIIDQYGYPGTSMVGPAQASTAFLVIQHADLEVQEKYLDIITAAANAGEVQWRSVALLVDRVYMRRGGKQIYGSQVGRDPDTGAYFFSEIENPHKIDSIRATVGLGPLQQYADNWNFTWDPDAHIKRWADKKEEKKE